MADLTLAQPTGANVEANTSTQVQVNGVNAVPNNSKSHRLHNRIQSEQETVADYAAALRELSVHCQFGPCLEHALRDQFIAGMKDSATQEKLFRKNVDEVTFNVAVRDAISAEKARSECRVLREQQSSTVAVVRTKKNVPRSTVPSGFKCFGCGDAHYRRNCPYKNSKCRKCEKKGHIAKACKSSNSKPTSTEATTSSAIKDSKNATHAVLDKSMYANAINMIENVQGHNSYSFAEAFDSNCLNTNSHLNTDASFVSVKLGEVPVPVTFQLDCGSPETLVNYNTFDLLGINEDELLAYTKPLYSYTGGSVDIRGHMLIPVKFRSVSTKLDMVVVNGPRPNILGRSWFTALGIKIQIVSNLNAGNPNFFSEFKDVFASGLGKFKGSKISLDLGADVTPIAFPPRRIPIGIKPAVEEEISNLLKKGVLIPIDKSDWATTVVPVVKPDGSIRLCADYRMTLNKVLKPKVHPIPMVTHALAEKKGSKFFAKLDLSQAYLQLEVDETSALAQTITTHLGLFKVTRLQFGLNVAPSLFQEFIDNLLKNITGIIKYLDDILIFSNSIKSLNTTIRQILTKFQ